MSAAHMILGLDRLAHAGPVLVLRRAELPAAA
jgi:hypothetical protein